LQTRPPAHTRVALSDNSLSQYGLTTGPQVTCGPTQNFYWPAETVKKNLQI